MPNERNILYAKITTLAGAILFILDMFLALGTTEIISEYLQVSLALLGFLAMIGGLVYWAGNSWLDFG